MCSPSTLQSFSMSSMCLLRSHGGGCPVCPVRCCGWAGRGAGFYLAAAVLCLAVAAAAPEAVAQRIAEALAAGAHTVSQVAGGAAQAVAQALLAAALVAVVFA